MTHMKMSSLFVDTRVIDCGENLEQLKKLPDQCIDLVYIDPPSDSDGTLKEFWKELKEKVAFKDCPNLPKPTLISCGPGGLSLPVP